MFEMKQIETKYFEEDSATISNTKKYKILLRRKKKGNVTLFMNTDKRTLTR